MMKKNRLLAWSLCLLSALTWTDTMAQINMPQPSPSGSLTAKLGLTDIEISYFRPQLRGRKIFGSGDDFLLQHGTMWRAGANQGTNVKFSTAVKFGNTDVQAGEYKLLAKPGADEWTIVLEKDLSVGGDVSEYDESQAIALAKVKPTKVSPAVSTLTFNISDVSEDGAMANLELAWENVLVKVPLSVSFDEEVMESIAERTVIDPDNLRAAADYYVKTGRDIDQAIKWYDSYLTAEDNSGHFWVIHAKAKALAKKGDKKGAIATAKLSIEKAKAWEEGDYGYIKRNEKLIASLK